MAVIAEDWGAFFKGEFGKPYYRSLSDFVRDEYARGNVYPPREQIFEAFRFTKRSDVKVVILGQDPYHEVNQAHEEIKNVLRNKLKVEIRDS